MILYLEKKIVKYLDKYDELKNRFDSIMINLKVVFFQ